MKIIYLPIKNVNKIISNTKNIKSLNLWFNFIRLVLCFWFFCQLRPLLQRFYRIINPLVSPSAGDLALNYGDVNTVTPSPGEVKWLIASAVDLLFIRFFKLKNVAIYLNKKKLFKTWNLFNFVFFIINHDVYFFFRTKSFSSHPGRRKFS